jgi:hypothetical protein
MARNPDDHGTPRSKHSGHLPARGIRIRAKVLLKAFSYSIAQTASDYGPAKDRQPAMFLAKARESCGFDLCVGHPRLSYPPWLPQHVRRDE